MMHSAGAIWQAAVKLSIPNFICNRVSPGEHYVISTPVSGSHRSNTSKDSSYTWQGIRQEHAHTAPSGARFPSISLTSAGHRPGGTGGTASGAVSCKACPDPGAPLLPLPCSKQPEQALSLHTCTWCGSAAGMP